MNVSTSLIRHKMPIILFDRYYNSLPAEDISEPRHEKNLLFAYAKDRASDDRLCFRYIDRTIPLRSKSKFSCP